MSSSASPPVRIEMIVDDGEYRTALCVACAKRYQAGNRFGITVDGKLVWDDEQGKET